MEYETALADKWNWKTMKKKYNLSRENKIILSFFFLSKTDYWNKIYEWLKICDPVDGLNKSVAKLKRKKERKTISIVVNFNSG